MEGRRAKEESKKSVAGRIVHFFKYCILLWHGNFSWKPPGLVTIIIRYSAGLSRPLDGQGVNG